MLTEQNLKQPSAEAQGHPADYLRIERAFHLAVIGLSLAAALVVFLNFRSGIETSDILSIVGLFTSVLGTLVGAFFGLQVVSASKLQADRRADQAQRKVEALHAAADQDTINRAYQLYPEIFK